VDDDQGFRTAIGRLLRAAGYEVREYASAGALLMSDEEQTPGCVLLDMKMPGPSGLDLQEALAKRDRKLPIIFPTALADVRNSVRAMKAGAMDFLAKPVKREALLGDRPRGAGPGRGAARIPRADPRASRPVRRAEPREREVLRHVVVAVASNKQIASATARRSARSRRTGRT
jgi:FixJ family two-component response regulator